VKGHLQRQRCLGDRRALRQGLVGLPELRDYLLGTVAASESSNV
jgi:hypothetical protein